jgi:hypothetical protein
MLGLGLDLRGPAVGLRLTRALTEAADPSCPPRAPAIASPCVPFSKLLLHPSAPFTQFYSVSTIQHRRDVPTLLRSPFGGPYARVKHAGAYGKLLTRPVGRCGRAPAPPLTLLPCQSRSSPAVLYPVTDGT